ncbi:MAG: hypothetical protein QW566_08105 [Candidatus Jordarchaeales archaeon]
MMDQVEPALRSILLGILEEMERQQRERVTRDEFIELRQVVQELCEAQKKTEEQIKELTRAVGELTEAQKKTEQRLDQLTEAQRKTEQRLNELAEAQRKTEQTVNELTEAQKKTEQRLNELAEAQRKTEQRLNELAEAQRKTEQTVNELAEAQRKTEQRLNELAEAQRKTEQTVNELTEAQKKTEQRLNELAEAQKKTEKELAALAKQVGGLSNAVGYGIEDRLMAFIPAYIQKTYRLRTISVGRKNIVYPSGEYDEVNIFTEAVDPEGKKFYVIGECKAQPGKKDVDRFVKKVRRLEAHLKASIYPLLVGYSFSPEIERYISQRYPFINTAMTYEIEMIGRGQSFP